MNPQRDDGAKARVYADQVATVYRLATPNLIASVVSASVLWWFLRPAMPGLWAAWFGGHIAVAAARYALGLAYRRAPHRLSTQAWARCFVAGTLCTGVMWGLMGTPLFPLADAQFQLIATGVLVGVAASGLAALSPLPVAFAALLVPSQLPFTLAMLTWGTTVTLMIGVAGSTYFVLMLINANRINRTTVANITQQIEIARLMQAAQDREELVAAKEAAEAANLAKAQFLATISHEIRTPINGVLGMAELLMDSRLTQAQHRSVQTLRDSGGALLHIVNDILDFSRMQSGKLKLETADFDLRELTRSALDLLTERAHAKGLRIVTSIDSNVPAAVSGDPGALRQVLVNLVGNAVKFTDRGEVTVAVTRVPDAGAGAGEERCLLLFAIRDTGIGIAPQAREALFKAFTQSDGSHSRRFGGTGLGLVISKQLVELMGGAIQVESAPGKGSTFSFTVRFSPAAHAALTSDAAQPRQDVKASLRVGLRVLLVEDNKVNQQVCQAMLRTFGCEVDVAENGRLGVEAMFSRRYDIVLMDCQMPEMDGFEATAAIRAREAQGDGVSDSTKGRTPIVALTANAMAGDRERCLAAGMDDYLSKPYNKQQLADLIARWIDGALPQRALAA